jgi:hypothetical protein
MSEAPIMSNRACYICGRVAGPGVIRPAKIPLCLACRAQWNLEASA